LLIQSYHWTLHVNYCATCLSAIRWF